MAGMRTWAIVALAPWVLVGTSVHAEGFNTALNFTPNFLSVEVKKDEHNKLQDARLDSDLEGQLRHHGCVRWCLAIAKYRATGIRIPLPVGA